MSCEQMEKVKECFDKHAEDGKLRGCKVWPLMKDLMELKGCKPEDMKMKGQGQRPNPGQMCSQFKEWDTDGDKMLSWEEFQEGPLKKMKEMMECNK